MLGHMVNLCLAPAGLKIVRATNHVPFPVEFDEMDKSICQYVLDNNLSMVGSERLYSTLMACRYVAEANVEGDFVECGVWRGGNSIIAADVFRRLAKTKSSYLFDTFAGMTRPSANDFRNGDGTSAQWKFQRQQRESHNEWCFCSLEDVMNNFRMRGLLTGQVRFVKGDVLDTLTVEENLPEKIAVLRLDTDWYESTMMELEVLWPRLERGGILIVDDYGHWNGARKAVDEFFRESNRPFLQYVDYTGRVAIKIER
jgi:O-methyltransferase